MCGRLIYSGQRSVWECGTGSGESERKECDAAGGADAVGKWGPRSTSFHCGSCECLALVLLLCSRGEEMELPDDGMADAMQTAKSRKGVVSKE